MSNYVPSNKTYEIGDINDMVKVVNMDNIDLFLVDFREVLVKCIELKEKHKEVTTKLMDELLKDENEFNDVAKRLAKDGETLTKDDVRDILLDCVEFGKFKWIDDGFSAVAELLSPWNIRYYLTVFITFLPAVGLYWIKEKIEDKIQAKPAEQ